MLTKKDFAAVVRRVLAESRVQEMRTIPYGAGSMGFAHRSAPARMSKHFRAGLAAAQRGDDMREALMEYMRKLPESVLFSDSTVGVDFGKGYKAGLE